MRKELQENIMMRKWKYLAVYLTPALVALSMYLPGWWSYTALIVLFGILPAIELFSKGSTVNVSKAEEEVILQDKTYDWMLYGLVPVQYLLLVYFLFVMQQDLPFYEWLGNVITFGLSCGVIGINAAHELGHRLTKQEQNMSKALLLTSLYMHFFIEHNRGHHKNVSTDEDPASAKYGETVFAFYFRSVIGSWLSAWHLEKERLKRTSEAFWSLKNEMLRFQIIQILLLAAIFFIFGTAALLAFIFAAVIGFLLLETVNYIEHYGLRRKKKDNGYERTLPIHSWNSNHPFGRLLLLELSRHSDHHYIASRKYPVLRHFDESPQMPTGYPGMMLLALIPPLWFKVMHKAIDKYKATAKGVGLE